MVDFKDKLKKLVDATLKVTDKQTNNGNDDTDQGNETIKPDYRQTKQKA